MTKLEQSNIIRAMKLTSREEDYLETIYRLSQTLDSVGVSDVAHERGVTLPTVKSALNRLKENGLISQRHYGKIMLNATGKKKAEEIYKAHKTLKTFLNKILRLPSELSEKEACSMEHGMSKETLKRLVTFMELIQNCPEYKSGCLDKYLKLQKRGLNKR